MERLAQEVLEPDRAGTLEGVVVVGPDEAQTRAAQVLLTSEAEGLQVLTAPDAATAVEHEADLAVLFAATVADVRTLADAVPRPQIVVVTADETTLGARRLLDAGADAIVAASHWMLALGPVCRAVAAGHVCVPSRHRGTVDPPALSLRERQVLALMAAGLNTAQIAERLFLARSTVKSHSASAFRRLGVKSRREAVALVLGSDDALRRIVLTSHPEHRFARGEPDKALR